MSPITSVLAQAECEDDIVIQVTPEEYDRAVQHALDELGITYEELERQARNRDFQSHQAQLLWVAIGGRDRDC